MYGVDASEVMVRQATNRNVAGVRAGRVDLTVGSVERLPALGEPLDKALAVNSMGFWPAPAQGLKELRSKLRPGGLIAIASQPRCSGATSETSDRVAREIQALLEKAASLEPGSRPSLKPPVVCVLGVNEEPAGEPG